MKVIQFLEEDGEDLLTRIELVKLRESGFTFERNLAEKLSEKELTAVYHAVHRAFHYQVCSWLRDMGWGK